MGTLAQILLKAGLWLGGELLRSGLARRLALDVLADVKARHPELPIPDGDGPHPLVDAIEARIKARLG